MKFTLLNFEVYSTVFLTIWTLLYSKSPDFFHLAWMRLCPLNSNSHLTLHQPQITNLFPASMNLITLDESRIIQWLSFNCHIPLSIMPSSFIHTAAYDSIFLFLRINNILLHVHTAFSWSTHLSVNI